MASKNIKTLEDALVMELRDLLNAEKHVMRALQKMAKKASSEDLKSAFELHKEQTVEQIDRLEKAFEAMGIAPRAKRCHAIEGILEEGKEIMEEEADPAARDAMMIAAAQKVEHYEMASYGTAATWAERLGHDEVARLLRETLEQEKETDAKLTELAESEINEEATV
jgi:ferritin-like metal-binding protein YciE